MRPLKVKGKGNEKVGEKKAKKKKKKKAEEWQKRFLH